MKNEYFKKVDKERLEKEKAYIHDHRNEIGRCPYCDNNIKDRLVAIHRQLVDALYKVYCWCGKNKKHEFHMREIRHLFDKTQYNRFGDLVRFGGLVYKPKVDGHSAKAFYGLNMARSKEFFAGTRDIPIQITLDQITNEVIGEVRGKVGDFPELSAFIKDNGLYDHELPVQAILGLSTGQANAKEV